MARHHRGRTPARPRIRRGDCPFFDPVTGEKLTNFWGYNSTAFAAAKSAYAASADKHGQTAEFRDMITAFHDAGIEVILDVVFNHTGEGDDRGRTFSFRGLDNSIYYTLDSLGRYQNFSGCGNTVNCNHPVVRSMLMDCLRYWCGSMHVDGFRFDLASIMGRDGKGNVMIEPPIVEEISEDGVLAGAKLIAEPWDAAGLYQVGRFPFGKRWCEWNGKYRDDVRRFWRGDPGMVGILATRLCGSSDLYTEGDRSPLHSVNFLTCHDGFTLNDLVSYNEKHNDRNGEGNRDGAGENFSWNSGAEGPTDNPRIIDLRSRRAKSMLTTLLISQGVPMLLGGDEFLRTQGGNNNAWCQDNETSWVNWKLVETNAPFLRFARELIQLRRRHTVLRRRTFFQGDHGNGRADITWHGIEPHRANFDHDSHSIAFVLDGELSGREVDHDFYFALHAGVEPAKFIMPASPSGRPWKLVIDTAAASPRDIFPEENGPNCPVGKPIDVASFAVVICRA
ncbi:MAG: alpha-amylase family glycosyl hydrolase [Gemmataceae bacterium]